MEVGEEYLSGVITLGNLEIPVTAFPNKDKKGNQPDWKIKNGGALWIRKKKAPNEVPEEKVE